MRVFQAPYTDRHGRKCKAKKWTVEFNDGSGSPRPRRVTGFTDMRQSEALGRQIDDLVSLNAAGMTLPPHMTKWIESMSPKLRDRLAEIGLLDTGRVAALRTLAEHLDGAADAPGFRQYLEAKANTQEYVDLICGRAKRVIDGCKAVYWSDVSASKVMAYLDGLRADKVKTDTAGQPLVDKRTGKPIIRQGKSAQTFNFYMAAFKAFCRFMVRDGRATESPVAHLDGLNVRTDRRHDRRALDIEEIRWLLTSPTARRRRAKPQSRRVTA